MSSDNAATWNTNSGQPVGYNQDLHGRKSACGRPGTTGIVSLLAGAGIGAAMMYLLDPEAGRERRDYVANQAGTAAEAVGGALGSAWQHASEAVETASEHAHVAADKALDYAGRARSDAADHASSFADRARGVASDASDWASAKFSDLRDAMPSRKTIRRSSSSVPARWSA